MSERMKSEADIREEYEKICAAYGDALDGSIAQKFLAQRGAALLWVLGLLGDKSLVPSPEALEVLNALQ